MWYARHSQLYMIINFHIFFGKFSEKQYAKLSEPWENDENFAQAPWNNAKGIRDFFTHQTYVNVVCFAIVVTV